MNKVQLIGRLTKDPELRYTKHNTPVASYTIAINTRYGEIEQTDYINISTWGKRAEFIKNYFIKGQQIALVGRLKNNNYEDNNGVKHYTIEVVTEEIEFVGSKKEEPTEDFTPILEVEDDELPF